MTKPQHLANDLLNHYMLKQPTLEDIVVIVGDYGYEIIDFEPGSPSAENLFQELSLDAVVCAQDAFLYTNHDVKLLFLKDHLDADEKKFAAAHELGHIICGHCQTTPSVKEEYEANEFVHFFLNPGFRIRLQIYGTRHKWRIGAIIIALGIFLAVGIVTYNSVMNQKYSQYYVTPSGKKYHMLNCIQINGKTNLRRLTREELASGEYKPCGTCLNEPILTNKTSENVDSRR